MIFYIYYSIMYKILGVKYIINKMNTLDKKLEMLRKIYDKYKGE